MCLVDMEIWFGGTGGLLAHVGVARRSIGVLKWRVALGAQARH